MPDPTPTPPDLAAQLSTLTEAMRQLVESNKSLLEAVKPAPQPSPAPAAAPTTVSGDVDDGAAPSALAAIDYSKLSPLQQITLGLRDSRPTRTPASGAD